MRIQTRQRSLTCRGPYYLMLHGTVQHNVYVYHAGQISLLRELIDL